LKDADSNLPGGSRELLGCGPRQFVFHQATHGFLESRVGLVRDDHYLGKQFAGIELAPMNV